MWYRHNRLSIYKCFQMHTKLYQFNRIGGAASSWVGGSLSGEVPRNCFQCGGIEQRSLWTWTGRGDTIAYMVFFRDHVVIQRCFPPFEAHDFKIMCFYTLITYMYWRGPVTTELYTFWTVGMSRCSNISQQTMAVPNHSINNGKHTLIIWGYPVCIVVTHCLRADSVVMAWFRC